MTKNKKKRINTGCAATNRLYTAVRDYVEKHGGDIVVIGGIAIVEENPLEPFKFGVMVRCLGKKPTKPTTLSGADR